MKRKIFFLFLLITTIVLMAVPVFAEDKGSIDIDGHYYDGPSSGTGSRGGTWSWDGANLELVNYKSDYPIYIDAYNNINIILTGINESGEILIERCNADYDFKTTISGKGASLSVKADDNSNGIYSDCDLTINDTAVNILLDRPWEQWCAGLEADDIQIDKSVITVGILSHEYIDSIQWLEGIYAHSSLKIKDSNVSVSIGIADTGDSSIAGLHGEEVYVDHSNMSIILPKEGEHRFFIFTRSKNKWPVIELDRVAIVERNIEYYSRTGIWTPDDKSLEMYSKTGTSLTLKKSDGPKITITGFYQDADGKWKAFTNGRVNTLYNGVAFGRYYKNGIQDLSFTGIAQDPTTKKWYKVKAGFTVSEYDITTKKGADGTALGKGASAECAEKAILSSGSDEGPKGSKFAPLALKSTSQGNNNINLAWSATKGAKKYVVYGNACGKKNKMKKLASVTGKKYNVKKIDKKLKDGTYHKFMVVALDKDNNVISASKVIHVATKGNKKIANPTKLTVKKPKTLKKGKAHKLNAKVSGLKGKARRAVSYESTNSKVATVSKKGVITVKSKGTCYVYAYTQNGLFKKVKVTVK